MQTTGRLEYAICGEQMSTIEDALNMARAGELTVTGSAWQFINPESYPFEPRRHCYILKSVNNFNNVDPLLRRIRNDKLFNTSVESNPHYYKYDHKDARRSSLNDTRSHNSPSLFVCMALIQIYQQVCYPSTHSQPRQQFPCAVQDCDDSIRKPGRYQTLDARGTRHLSESHLSDSQGDL